MKHHNGPGSGLGVHMDEHMRIFSWLSARKTPGFHLVPQGFSLGSEHGAPQFVEHRPRRFVPADAELTLVPRIVRPGEGVDGSMCWHITRSRLIAASLFT